MAVCGVLADWCCPDDQPMVGGRPAGSLCCHPVQCIGFHCRFAALSMDAVPRRGLRWRET